MCVFLLFRGPKSGRLPPARANLLGTSATRPRYAHTRAHARLAARRGWHRRRTSPFTTCLQEVCARATCTRTRAERRRTSPRRFCQPPAASASATSAALAAVWNCTHSTGAWTRVRMRVCMCVYVRVQTFIHTVSRNRRNAFKALCTSRWFSCSASAAPVARRAARRGMQAHGEERATSRSCVAKSKSTLTPNIACAFCMRSTRSSVSVG